MHPIQADDFIFEARSCCSIAIVRLSQHQGRVKYNTVLEQSALDGAMERKDLNAKDNHDDDDDGHGGDSCSTSSCEEFMFGVDFSNLDVSEIVEENEDFDIDSVKAKSDGIDKPESDFRIRIEELLRRTECDDFMKRLRSLSACESDYEHLFDLASNKGAQLDGIKCHKDAYGGRCLIATRDTINSTDTTATSITSDIIAVLPRSLRIGQHMACQRLSLPSHTPDLSALSLLLLDLMFQRESPRQLEGTGTIRAGADDKFFHFYSKCLPRHSFNAVNMSEKDKQYWSTFGQDYETAIRSVQSQAESCSKYIHECLSSQSQLKDDNSNLKRPPSISALVNSHHQDSVLFWAISMVQSRTHGFGTKRSRWLTPIFDFCNHSPTPNCTLEGDAFGRLVLKATRSIKAGEEVTIDYMVNDDAKLVATYGFSLLHKPPLSES